MAVESNSVTISGESEVFVDSVKKLGFACVLYRSPYGWAAPVLALPDLESVKKFLKDYDEFLGGAQELCWERLDQTYMVYPRSASQAYHSSIAAGDSDVE